MITQEELKKIVVYDPDTGVFKVRDDFTPSGNKKIRPGRILGWKTNNGHYLSVCLNKNSYYLHRLAFLYMTGNIPKYVDHINGDTLDNSWCNLRACSNQQNTSNKRVIRSVLGLKGVTRNKSRFAAQIMVNYKKIHLGTFDTPEQAHNAYMVAAEKYQGEFANSGITKKVPKHRVSLNPKRPENPKDQLGPCLFHQNEL